MWLLGGVRGCSLGGACMVAPGGACVVALGGCAWLLPGGHAWLLWGGMHGCSWGGMHGFCQGGVRDFSLGGGGHAWFLPGGACVVFPGGHAWFFLGGAWFFPGGMRGFSRGGVHRIRRDTVNERAVRILLECILVLYLFTYMLISFTAVSKLAALNISAVNSIFISLSISSGQNAKVNYFDLNPKREIIQNIIFTLGPAYNEFDCNEHLATTRRYLCIRIIRVFPEYLAIFTARNEVGARLCFYRRL